MTDSPTRRRRGLFPGLRTVPFVAAGVVGSAMALLSVVHPEVAWLAAILVVASSLAAVGLPWQRLPRWAPTVLALVTLVDVSVLMAATDDTSGSAALVLLPVFWLALFGRALQLALVLCCVPIALLAPALVSDSTTPADDLRVAVTTTAVAAALAFAAHVLVQEVRARRRAERAAHDRVRRILDTSPDTAVITWSPDRLVTGLNHGAEALFGFLEREAVGRLSPADLIGDEAVAALTAAVGYGNPADPNALEDDLILSGRWETEDRAVSGVTARIPCRGTVVWAHLDLNAITDDDGHAQEYVLVAHDITDLQQAQADLDSARRGLATVVEVLHRAQLGEDVRQSVCRQSRELAAADVAMMLERRGEELVVTAFDGLDVADLRVPLDGSASAAALSFAKGRSIQVTDTENDPRVSQELARSTGLRSLMYEPVRHDGTVVALLGVGWCTPRGAVSARTGESVWVLANEAGLAMHHERDVRSLADHARLDALTGLANRREWDAVLARELRTPAHDGAGPGRPVCLAMMDLDRFKAFNDTFGHQAGDELLRSAAAAWRRQLRSTDVLARYGGEEFGVLLPGCPLAEAERVLERVRKATPMDATVSVGLAQWNGREDARGLVGRADAALYDAKSGGRDRLVVAP